MQDIAEFVKAASSLEQVGKQANHVLSVCMSNGSSVSDIALGSFAGYLSGKSEANQTHVVSTVTAHFKNWSEFLIGLLAKLEEMPSAMEKTLEALSEKGELVPATKTDAAPMFKDISSECGKRFYQDCRLGQFGSPSAYESSFQCLQSYIMYSFGFLCMRDV